MINGGEQESSSDGNLHEEMQRFGLDPNDPEHLRIWAETTPQNSDQPVSYEEDRFAYGPDTNQPEAPFLPGVELEDD